VGRGVNIGAGTITANYDGVRKSETVIESGASIGSGTVLIAPVKVGKKAVTGAGAIVPKHHDIPPHAVFVGMPARELKSEK
jgi:bifunctional UDP-N-acetylglucosamine pyrophosphorylase/glucosamine-1-phosphate N-acetyltransferase